MLVNFYCSFYKAWSGGKIGLFMELSQNLMSEKQDFFFFQNSVSEKNKPFTKFSFNKMYLLQNAQCVNYLHAWLWEHRSIIILQFAIIMHQFYLPPQCKQVSLVSYCLLPFVVNE